MDNYDFIIGIFTLYTRKTKKEYVVVQLFCILNIPFTSISTLAHLLYSNLTCKVFVSPSHRFNHFFEIVTILGKFSLRTNGHQKLNSNLNPKKKKSFRLYLNFYFNCYHTCQGSMLLATTQFNLDKKQ